MKPSVRSAARDLVERLPAMPWNECPRSRGIDAHLPWNAQQAPEGAIMEAIIAATGWQVHSACGAMSGALGKKLGLIVTSAKEEGRGRVYRVGQSA